MRSVCQACSREFAVTEGDRKFYEQICPPFAGKTFAVPDPTKCPACREQQRLAYRNERNLYRRFCNSTGRPCISIYSPDKPYIIYENDAWWSESRDQLAFGRDFDFKTPFFPQFAELLLKTPNLNLLNALSENSAYTHCATRNKGCYMLFLASYNENCLYCHFAQESLACVDCYGTYRNQYCYECVDCSNCYSLSYGHNCRTASESWYLFDCVNCSACVGCTGLRNKTHYWLNQALSKKDYAARLEEFKKSPRLRLEVERRFQELKEITPRPWSQQTLAENCTGDYIVQCKDCFECLDAKRSEDCRHCQGIVDLKSSRDVTYFGYPGELLYQCNNVGVNVYRCLFSSFAYSSQNVLYCHNVHFSKNCFGCANLHHKEYCLLNKQYSKDEYEKLVPAVIEHMSETGEWGEFFPASLSHFSYNETPAQEHFPLTKEQAEEKGFKWAAVDEGHFKVKESLPLIDAGDIPPQIEEVSDDILDSAVICGESGKTFRITRAELSFYRAHGISLPRLHPNLRHRRRLALRNPRRLWSRRCAQCDSAIITSYTPERPETVYCEECYLRQF